MRNFLTVLYFSFFSLGVHAQGMEDESEILAQRGKGVVTQEQFTARVDKIPAEIRRPTLRDRKRVRDLINTLLLRSQLSSDAREADFDKDPVIAKRMMLAADAELANAWAEHYVATQPDADYEQLAHEYYVSNEDEFFTSPLIDVSHILISIAERSDEDAKILAESVAQQAKANPELFDDLVLTYSEDPSAASNHGKFTNIKKGDMVKPFEVSAFSMKKGEISEPVKTVYGYHIIRLDGRTEPERIAFDQVKKRLVEKERENHRGRIKQEYLEELTSLEVQMSEEALTEMVRRQFGEDYIKPKTDGEDSE